MVEVRELDLRAGQWWPILEWLRRDETRHAIVADLETRLAVADPPEPYVPLPMPLPAHVWTDLELWLDAQRLRAVPIAGQPGAFEIEPGPTARLVPKGEATIVQAVLSWGPGDYPVLEPWGRFPAWRRGWWKITGQRWRVYR
ncbi:MAG TPA: hypothetical protein VFX53_04500 [Pedococcus sp.]|nr:hypothetical protein [Pedococcus sp.]